jgi:hypothetical protein
MNSRAKGARGERQWRDELRAQGYEARRGQQFSGSPDSPDVVCKQLDWIHFEVKRVAKMALFEWMGQAQRDCGERVPVVVHRLNRGGWLVTIRLVDRARFGWPRDCGEVWAIVGRLGAGRWNIRDLFGALALMAAGRVPILICLGAAPALWTVRGDDFFRFLRGDVPPENKA